ncbi:MAG TPA: YdcH family protein [Gammaproteobacteria bacterium]
MFEYDQKIVSQLLEESEEFRELHEKHRQLDEQISEADSGVLPLDDLTLHRLKKEKLLLRDKMALLIDQHRKDLA